MLPVFQWISGATKTTWRSNRLSLLFRICLITFTFPKWAMKLESKVTRCGLRGARFEFRDMRNMILDLGCSLLANGSFNPFCVPRNAQPASRNDQIRLLQYGQYLKFAFSGFPQERQCCSSSAGRCLNSGPISGMDCSHRSHMITGSPFLTLRIGIKNRLR